MALLPDTAPGEKLLLRVWDTLIRDGIGGLLSPWQIRREGRARAEVRAEEMARLAQAEQDIADIRAGRKRIDVKGNIVEAPDEEEINYVRLDIWIFSERLTMRSSSGRRSVRSISVGSRPQQKRKPLSNKIWRYRLNNQIQIGCQSGGHSLRMC